MLLFNCQVGLVDAYAGIAQAVDADCNHGLAVLYLAELAFEALQRAAHNAHMVAGAEDALPHLHLCLALPKHETEVLNLGIGDDGGGALAGGCEQFEDEGLECELPDGALGHVDKDYHWDDDALYLLTAVAPLVHLALRGNPALDAHVLQLFANGTFAVYLDEGCDPLFWVRFAVVGHIDRRCGAFAIQHLCLCHFAAIDRHLQWCRWGFTVQS